MPRRRKKINKILPCLPIRGMTIFPHMVVHFDVGREKSVKALEHAMMNNQVIFITSQKDLSIEEPLIDDIFEVGTVAKIKQMLKMPGDLIRVLVEGLNRGRITRFIGSDPYFEVEVDENDESYVVIDAAHEEALMRSLLNKFEDYLRLSSKAPDDALISINTVQNPGQLADIIAASILVKFEDKQTVLDSFDVAERLENLHEILAREIQILEIEKEINVRVKTQIDKVQKDYYLREQMKAIQKELGVGEDSISEADEYRAKIQNANLPQEVLEKALKEAERLFKMPQGSPETGIIRTYLDWIMELPWNTFTEDNLDLKKASQILADEHYGLEKVKERVVEFLAVHQLTNNMKAPILCFVGPPGVGKTSIAKSIANSINRKFIRMSLGGVRDEAEIRGHRRTYIGAMPGRIISSIKIAGSKNPVLLFDEVDKIGNDFRGDPASALLEVLDSEQNHTFRDHYLELPFDLSKVMFLTTANSLETIPRALLDRMEVIRIAGYTDDEKVNIAKRHLIPKQLSEHGLSDKNIKISDGTLRAIINFYTREAGVRNLERHIATICRKAARHVIETSGNDFKVSRNNLNKLLGTRVFKYDMANESDEIGVVTGLAWTVVGGDTLSIEVITLKGKGNLSLTGHLGEVMKESARAGFSYIRSKAEVLGLNPEFHGSTDIHIHIPEGAIPKDGPSAGIAMTIATISALTSIPVRKEVAMTGEITLRGRVLAIGGLKEKILAAFRAGVTTVIIPEENKKDLDDIPDNIKKNLKIIPVEHMDEVLEIALVRMPIPLKIETEKEEGNNANS